jgi:cytochrome b involved in lipid metabolism
LGWIIYQGRPVMTLNNQPTAASVTPKNTTTDSGNPGNTATTYTMSQVVSHNTPSDCWSAINNEVYDLSTWVSRHPGGPQAITRLCGADGSGAFNNQHGSSRRAQAALVLLKIGQLK